MRPQPNKQSNTVCSKDFVQADLNKEAGQSIEQARSNKVEQDEHTNEIKTNKRGGRHKVKQMRTTELSPNQNRTCQTESITSLRLDTYTNRLQVQLSVYTVTVVVEDMRPTRLGPPNLEHHEVANIEVRTDTNNELLLNRSTLGGKF